MLLGREVERSVGGVQIAATALTVGDTVHDDLTEDRGQAAFPANLDPPAGDPVSVDHLRQEFLPLCSQVEMVLHSLPGQVPEPGREPRLQITVCQTSRLVARQPVHGPREQIP
jgi:hypothetical protein